MEKLFNAVPVHSYSEGQQRNLRDDISRYDLSTFSAKGAEAVKEELLRKYSVQPLKLDIDKKYLVAEPREKVVQIRVRDDWDEGRIITKQQKVLEWDVAIPFSGDASLFDIQPARYSYSMGRQMQPSIRAGELTLHYEEAVATWEQIEKLLGEDIQLIERNIGALDRDIGAYNASLAPLITQELAVREKEVAATRAVVEGLSIPIGRRG